MVPLSTNFSLLLPFPGRLLALIISVSLSWGFNSCSGKAVASSIKILGYETQSDQVRLRLQVLDNQRVPILGLPLASFRVLTVDRNGQGITLTPQSLRLIPPEQQSNPDPSQLIILLDMSGSMGKKDQSGQIKLQGAIAGISAFLDKARTENLPAQVALVPFGVGSAICKQGFAVNSNGIRASFMPVKDQRLDSQLVQLGKTKVCAATNIYDPLKTAVTYLGNPQNVVTPTGWFSDPEDQPPPRLAVILFSDGFHINRRQEPQQFQSLVQVLKQHPQVTVHTLAYGESLTYLRDRAQCSRRILNKELTIDRLARFCTLPDQDINEYIVDEPRLQEIASVTGGIYKQPQTASQVAQALNTFLTTLREYQLVYRQPDGDRASQHQTQVVVSNPERQLNQVVSLPMRVRLDNFLFRSPSKSQRWSIFVMAGIMMVGALLPFLIWSSGIKAQAKKDLRSS